MKTFSVSYIKVKDTVNTLTYGRVLNLPQNTYKYKLKIRVPGSVNDSSFYYYFCAHIFFLSCHYSCSHGITTDSLPFSWNTMAI